MLISPKLKLRINEGTDPFSLDDFVFNLNALDAAPGIAPGLSSGRPSWDSSQAGRVFVETDTQRLIMWNGSAWVDLYQNAQAFRIKIASPTIGTPAAGHSATYNFPTFTLKRPSIITGQIIVSSAATQAQFYYCTYDALIDGSVVSDAPSVGRRAPTGTGGTNDYFHVPVTFQTGLLAAGTAHTPAVRVNAQTGNVCSHNYAIFLVNASAA